MPQVELLPVTYDPERLHMWADENFRRIADIIGIFSNPGGLSIPAGNVVAGTFGANVGNGAYTFPSNITILGNTTALNGFELYHPAGAPYIDFHRSADSAGDSGADYNMRFINDANQRLSVHGGILKVLSSIATNLASDGAGAGLEFAERDDNITKWAWYATADLARIWRTGVGDVAYYGDNYQVIANTRIGTSLPWGALYATVHYYNLTGAGDYALLQSNDGHTYVNASSGKSLWLRNNNVTRVEITGSNTGFIGTVTIDAGAGGGFAGIVGMRDFPLRLRAPNDTSHFIGWTAAYDGPMVSGWNSVALKSQLGAAEHAYYSDGSFQGNKGWGVISVGGLGIGILVGSAGGSGGGLRTRGGGNYYTVQWDGTLRHYIDATNVKNFVIDNPLDKEKYLIHACLEGPEAGVYYRGQGQLVNGWVAIQLPDYFEELCQEEGRSVQLTCIADDPEDEWCPVLHATYPKNGKFYVGLGSGHMVNDQKFWWEVKAIRKDVGPLNIEPLKSEVEIMGSGPYTYYKER